MKATLQEELVSLSRSATALSPAQVVLTQHWKRSGFERPPEILLLHAGVAAEVILGLKLKLEGLRVRVGAPWLEGEPFSVVSGSRAKLAVLSDAMAQASTVVGVMETAAPDPPWLAWAVGFSTGAKKPLALLHLPSGAPVLDELSSWARYCPYLIFGQSQMGFDSAWVYEEELSTTLHDWIRGRIPHLPR